MDFDRVKIYEVSIFNIVYVGYEIFNINIFWDIEECEEWLEGFI